jgi:hypothetical protein
MTLSGVFLLLGELETSTIGDGSTGELRAHTIPRPFCRQAGWLETAAERHLVSEGPLGAGVGSVRVLPGCLSGELWRRAC